MGAKKLLLQTERVCLGPTQSPPLPNVLHLALPLIRTACPAPMRIHFSWTPQRLPALPQLTGGALLPPGGHSSHVPSLPVDDAPDVVQDHMHRHLRLSAIL